MLVAFDIGNSDITIGVHDDSSWIQIWRLPAENLNEVFLALKLQNFFLEAGLHSSQVNGAVISSVVPDATPAAVHVATALYGCKPVVVGVPVYDKLPVRVLNPYQIGTDLVANAVAAFSIAGRKCAVVDFGTALSFTVVDDGGEIIGVAIAPGLKTALRSLSQNTARLFDVPLEFPPSVLGKDTVHAIQAGLLFGYEGIVENILKQIRHEAGHDITSIATGGLSSMIPSLKDKVDRIIPTLTLDGLRIIFEKVYRA